MDQEFMQLDQVASNLSALKVCNNLTLYYSYKTIVAFNNSGKLEMSKNVWSRTTGKHLNIIERLPHDTEQLEENDVFTRRLQKIMQAYKANRSLANLE